MQQGLLISCLEAESLPEALRITADIGYTNCEIGVLPDDWRPNLATLSEDERRAAVDLASELGLTISAVQCHMHNGYADVDPAVRRDAVDHTRRMVDLCTRFRIPVCHTVSGVAEDDASWDAKLDRVVDCLGEVLDHAVGTGVKVALEPVFVYVVGNLAHTRELLRRLDERSDMYINYDPSHFPYHDEPAEEFIRAFSERIVHAHSKDAVVRPLASGEQADERNRFAMPGGRAFRFAAPGKGVLDWTSVLGALRAAGFDGVLSLEMGHGYDGSPNDIARDTDAFFRDGYGIP